MNFQEKYTEYKQRQEAKKFFNQNNDYHLSTIDYIKIIVIGTVIAMFSTIVFELIGLQIGWSFSFFNILTGYFTGSIVLKIAKYGSQKVGIASIICYVLGTFFAPAAMYYVFWRQMLSLSMCFQIAMAQYGDLISILFIVVGAITAYETSKN